MSSGKSYSRRGYDRNGLDIRSFWAKGTADYDQAVADTARFSGFAIYRRLTGKAIWADWRIAKSKLSRDKRQ